MTSTLALLSSPLLGPAVWRPVADELARRGVDAVRPRRPSTPPRSPDDVLEHLVDALPDDRELVLVPHSNAGAYVPLLTERRRVAGVVFVDAVLPPRAGPVQLAPEGLLTLLREKTDRDGLLPPWTEWWPDTAPLFPDAATRARVEGEQHRLPLTYFAQQLPVPAGWDERPAAYVAFGDTYAGERADAARRGWPVCTMPGSHLHMLTDPAAVAGRLLALVDPFSATGSPPAPR